MSEVQPRVQVQRFSPGETGRPEILDPTANQARIAAAEQRLAEARADYQAKVDSVETWAAIHRNLNAAIVAGHAEAESLGEKRWQEIVKHYSAGPSEPQSLYAARLREIVAAQDELGAAVDRIVLREGSLARLAVMEAEAAVARAEGDWYTAKAREAADQITDGLARIGPHLGLVSLENSAVQQYEALAAHCSSRAWAIEQQIVEVRARRGTQ